ncbi:MAG: tRNA (guanosine(37)-N1)-methyltransferase TrmD [Deltaproteobacteria bacterium]|nr:tRNA (guanosine(37)-N1)-methyltransferase TrmD [Deltaproteobacteria bacterium]
MRCDVVTLFPGMFTSPLGDSLFKRAVDAGRISVHFHNPRDVTTDRHRTVDDAPYGGGPGMVMMVEPLVTTIESIPTVGKKCVVLLSPAGERMTQSVVRDLAGFDQLVLVCGRYEGIDERVRELVVDRELSVGDFVVSGGELPAMMVMDAVMRVIPGTLGNELSAASESFEGGLLEYPQYTRPVEFRGKRVPDILLSGHHADIDRWRKDQALERTTTRRPDLIDKTSRTR